MNKILSILAGATLAAVVLTGCGTHKLDTNELREQVRTEVEDAMATEIRTMSLDSIAATTVYVEPQIVVDEDSSSQNALRMVAVVMPFAFVIALVLLVLYFKRQNLLSKYRIVELSILNRQPLPESFYSGKRDAITAVNRRRLFNGMVWIAFGLVGVLFFSIKNENSMAVLCLLPVFIGIAKLVSYFVEQRDLKKSAGDNM